MLEAEEIVVICVIWPVEVKGQGRDYHGFCGDGIFYGGSLIRD